LVFQKDLLALLCLRFSATTSQVGEISQEYALISRPGAKRLKDLLAC